ncbi:hypothetical protein KKH82_01070 [Patescibacteria group bacterium]|nr:hypothetical protein [Patescibacteria group bacterium]
MPKTISTCNDILIELKIIQLQLTLAKRSAKKLHTPKSTLTGVESHINHSLHSLNHLIAFIDDFNAEADSCKSTRHRTKETK